MYLRRLRKQNKLTLDSFIDIPNDNTNNDVIDKDRKALVLKSFGRRGVKS